MMPGTDSDLQAMLRDPRWRESWREGSAAYRSGVNQAFAARYPGQAQRDATGRLVPISGYTRMVERHGEEVAEEVGLMCSGGRRGGRAAILAM